MSMPYLQAARRGGRKEVKEEARKNAPDFQSDEECSVRDLKRD